jgi:hypothetical protein
MVTIMGGTCTETFSRKNSHLIVADPNLKSEKLRKAKDWRIPVHDIHWLYSFLTETMITESSEQEKISVKSGEEEVKIVDSIKRISNNFEKISQQNRQPEKLQFQIKSPYFNRSVNQRQEVVYQEESNEPTQKSHVSELFSSAPHILLSGIALNERDVIIGDIERLGAIVIDSDKWVQSCSILVVKEPVKTEKFLCAVARSIPIVIPSFIHESAKIGKFLDVESFFPDSGIYRLCSKPFGESST